MDRCTDGGGRGRDRHDRVPGAPGPGPGGMEAALQPKPRPPRPPKLDGTALAELARLACSTPPPGRARWTLKLLAAELVALEVVDSIAPETVRRALILQL